MIEIADKSATGGGMGTRRTNPAADAASGDLFAMLLAGMSVAPPVPTAGMPALAAAGQMAQDGIVSADGLAPKIPMDQLGAFGAKSAASGELFAARMAQAAGMADDAGVFGADGAASRLVAAVAPRGEQSVPEALPLTPAPTTSIDGPPVLPTRPLETFAAVGDDLVVEPVPPQVAAPMRAEAVAGMGDEIDQPLPADLGEDQTAQAEAMPVASESPTPKASAPNGSATRSSIESLERSDIPQGDAATQVPESVGADGVAEGQRARPSREAPADPMIKMVDSAQIGHFAIEQQPASGAPRKTPSLSATSVSGAVDIEAAPVDPLSVDAMIRAEPAAGTKPHAAVALAPQGGSTVDEAAVADDLLVDPLTLDDTLGPEERTELMRVERAYAQKQGEATVPAQIVSVVAHAARSKLDRLRVSLNPDELGSVDIELSYDSEGRVSVAIAVERPETLDLLQRQSRSLESMLQAVGIDLQDGIDLGLSGGDALARGGQASGMRPAAQPWMNGSTGVGVGAGTTSAWRADRILDLSV